jgi:hypothetical protein
MNISHCVPERDGGLGLVHVRKNRSAGLALGGDGQWPPQCEFALKPEGLKRARVWLCELTSQRLLDAVQEPSGVGVSRSLCK